MVHGRPGHGISHFGELLLPQKPKIRRIGARRQVLPIDASCTDCALAISEWDWRLSAILALGMCGYTAIPEDGRTYLFVILCVSTVTDFSAEDKASGVKFCTAVYRHHGHGISHFGEVAFQKPKIGRIEA